MTEKIEMENQNWARSYFTLWAGQAVSVLGSQIVQFGLIWWLTSTTGSATVLATASILGLLPQVFISPIAGALVDRWNRRWTMMISDSSVALATLLLVFLFASGRAEIWHIYLLMFVRSVAGSFHWPAMQASTSLMVPREKLSHIQGLNQTLNGGLNILSAPVGALLVGILPMHSLLLVDVGTALLGVFVLFLIRIPQPTAAASPSEMKTTVWQDFSAGLRYVWSWPGLVMILVMAIFINLLLTPTFVLLPVLVTKYFKGQAFELAWMQTGFSVGMVAGGVLLSVWGGFRRRILTTMLGLVGIGLGNLAVGLMPASAFIPALLALFVAGFSGPITNGPLFATLQATVAPEMQGRVFTLINSAASAMAPLGLLLAGPIADAYGVQVWFIAGGILTMLMAIAGLFIPAVMHFEDGPPEIGKTGKTRRKSIFQAGD